MFSENPAGADLVLLACAPRSGSTLLLRILDSHSAIAAPCEIPLVSFFDPGDPHYSRLKEKLAKVCDYYAVDLRQALDDPGRLFDAIRDREGKRLLVLKHPHQSLYLDRLVRRFHLRILYLTRDARSSAMTSFYRDDRDRGLARWLQIHSGIQRALAKIPASRVYGMRYEDLVLRPKESMEGLTRFLALPFEAKMLDYGKHSHADDRMALWDGKTSEQCGYHQGLSLNTVSAGILQDRENFDASVLRSYAGNADLRYRNRYLGYDTEADSCRTVESRKLRYCFAFVCQQGTLEIKSLLLAASLRRHLHCAHEIVACVPQAEEPSQVALAALQALGVRVQPISNPLAEDYPIGNKLACLAIETCADKRVFLDSDILCMRHFHHEPRFLEPVSLRIAGNVTWGRDVSEWKRVYREFGLSPPAQRYLTSVTRRETLPYYNSGVIFSDADNGLASTWIDTCCRIDANQEISGKRPWLDQIGLPVALARLQLPVDLLPESYNYPGGAKNPVADRPPLFLHYHDPHKLLKFPEAVKLITALIVDRPEIGLLLSSSPDWQPIWAALGSDGLRFHE